MLKYLEQLTVDLMIPAIVIGMLYVFIKFKLGKPCRIIYLAGGGFSVAASVFVAIQKNTNRELKLPFWNGFTYIILSVLVISSAVFILSMFVWLAVKKGSHRKDTHVQNGACYDDEQYSIKYKQCQPEIHIPYSFKGS